jgi:pyruvate kinase
MLKTKIVCTIGPACSSEDVLRQLLRSGMNVARINFSHGRQEEHGRNIALIRQLAVQERRVVAIMADLQGPKFRVGLVENDSVTLEAGRSVLLTTRAVLGNGHEINLPHPELIADMQPGNHILLDDGLLELIVEQVTPLDALCQIVTGGALGSHKGVSLIGGHLNLPAVTDKDRQDLSFAVQQGVDYIAQSFVRREEDVETLRQALRELHVSVPIIAKIEKAEALSNFEGILAVSDGIMVARGDLGVETSVAEVPIHQKRIIRATNRAAKPVITATQMLNSMIWNPRPTRAEASDVANAVLDGTDAVMLSGETAVGQYPLAAVQMMARIAESAESTFPFDLWAYDTMKMRADSVTASICQATCEMALELGAAAIVTTTRTGHTARAVASHRPGTPILAMTPSVQTAQRLALVWGVEPHLIGEAPDTDEMIRLSTERAIQENGLHSGDLVVFTAGTPFNTKLKTNMIQVHAIP